MRYKMSNQKRQETRRAFLKSAGAFTAGLYLASQSSVSAAKPTKVGKERLALFGGPKAVTYPDKKHGEAFRWPIYGQEDEEAVVQVLRNPSYAPIGEFEKDWKEYYKAPYVRAYCNGTSALTTMFFALNLPPGSEIMVPSYTFFATIVPMRLFGLVPVFVDIHPRTLNFDLDDAKGRLTKNTKALLPVHWLGLPCEMDQICDWAKEKGLIVLEDAAHAHGASMATTEHLKRNEQGNASRAHGASLQYKLMGLWSRMSIFSYQATKPLPSIEGGMGMYQNREDFERATTFGHYDLPAEFPESSAYKKYHGTGLGLKFRMHPIAAALARVQLRLLDERNAKYAAQVRRLNDQILELPGLYEQPARPDMRRVYYAFNMLFLDEKKAGMSRETCVKALKAEGVRSTAYSYRLQHKCPLYVEENWWHHKPVIAELPGSEQANRTAISLPLFTSEVPELVDQYAKAFEKVWAHREELGRG